jgi:hypothetical protein
LLGMRLVLDKARSGQLMQGKAMQHIPRRGGHFY